MYELVKKIEHKNKKIRVVFFAEYHAQWEPSTQKVIGIYDSLETAEKEAKGNISWLSQE